MGRPKKDAERVASAVVSARITAPEKRLLDALLERRRAAMEARHEPGDDSFVGWLRWMIRTQAAAEGLSLDSKAPERPTTPRKTRA